MFQVEASLQNSSSNSPSQVEAAKETAADCLGTLAKLEGDKDAVELAKLLTGPWVDGLLSAHDKIAASKAPTASASATFNSSANNSVTAANQQAVPHHFQPAEGDALLERLQHYEEPNIKVVRIEKTSEHLGATVKNDGEAVVVARIIRGGMAEASGLLHEGDEILEVNEVELRGKDVNEVCDILTSMQGTLTFLVVPTRHHLSVSPSVNSASNGGRLGVVHLKAHIDYDPFDDPYVPCRDLGISFQKGEILHVINQRDPHWWQARRDGETEALAGLIPSANFLAQREAMKHTIAQDTDRFDGTGGSLGGRGGRGPAGFRRARSGFLCAKKSGRNKKNKKHAAYGPDEEMEAADEIVTYEEVALYYPRSDRKRPVVLIGPPNIGRHELRQRLMNDTDRFAADIPRKCLL